jgi:hypothetical protein
MIILLSIALGLMILLGLYSCIFSLMIFFPKDKRVYSQYKSEFYGTRYKENNKIDISKILERELAKKYTHF